MKNAKTNKPETNMTSVSSGFHPDTTRIFLAALIVMLYPDVSFAEIAPLNNDPTVGTMFCRVLKNSGEFPPLFSGIAYITGAWIVVRGLFDMMKRSSDPNNKPFKDGILGITMGGMVAALPALIRWLHETILGDTVRGNGITCQGGASVGTSSAVPLDVMLSNFVGNITPGILALISGMAVIFGVVMIFYNMVKLSKFGTDAKTSTLTPIIGSLIIGALLVAVGQTMDVSLSTLFGTNTTMGSLTKYKELAYQPGGTFDMSRFNNAMNAVFTFLRIVGTLSFVRGFFVMKNALEGTGQATKGQAYTHIIGGTLLVNMPGFIQYIEQSVGFKVITPQ